MDELVDRGVVRANALRLVADHDPERVADAVGYFDQQRPGSVGPGVLVAAIREGRQAQRVTVTPAAQQRDRWRQTAAWCHENLPDVCGPGLEIGAFQYIWRRELRPEDLSVELHGDGIRHAIAVVASRFAVGGVA